LANLIVPDIGQAESASYAPQCARLAEGLAKSQFAFEAQGMDVAAIADRCATVAGQKGPLALVVVDSLQLVDDRSGGPPGALKRLAVELRAPIVVTSQVPRAVGLRPDKRPRPVDLRLSAPEFEAVDRFVCLYRDECHEPDSETPGAMEIAAHDRRGVTRVLTPFDSESGRLGPPEAWER
jgi:replicative DNA helicase